MNKNEFMTRFGIDEATVCYRVLTGACSFGVQDFLERKVKEPKDKYTIAEIIDLTRGEYGGDRFESFFENSKLAVEA